MAPDFKCFIGLHHYEEYKEESLIAPCTGAEVGKVIIMKCSNCGKIKSVTVRTLERL